MNFVWFILVGAVAGWLAGQIMKGKGFGLIGNIVVGIIGGIIGGWLFDFFDIIIVKGTIGYLITALIGAIVLLFIVGLFKKK